MVVRRRIQLKKPVSRRVKAPVRKRRFYRKRMSKTIVPPVLTTKVRYMDYFNMATGGVSAYQTVPFRMNGAYDPVANVGGGTCTGWGQLASLYGKYRVLASKIEIWAYNTCQSPIIVSVFARSSTGSAPTSSTEVQQKSFEYNQDVRTKQLVPFTTGNGYPKCYLSMYKSIKRLEGNKYNQDEDYTGATTTTPVLQTYWDVNLCALDGTAVSCTANYTIRITYYTKFSEVIVTYTD